MGEHPKFPSVALERILKKYIYLTWLQSWRVTAFVCVHFCGLLANPKLEVCCKEKIRHVRGRAQVKSRCDVDIGTWVYIVDPRNLT